MATFCTIDKIYGGKKRKPINEGKKQILWNKILLSSEEGRIHKNIYYIIAFKLRTQKLIHNARNQKNQCLWCGGG